MNAVSNFLSRGLARFWARPPAWAGLRLAGIFIATSAFGAEEFPVTILVDAAQLQGELRPVWRFFGYDEPNFTYMKDGKKLLSELAQLGPEQVFIRCHHLLTSGDG